jgi:hypothetical protein
MAKGCAYLGLQVKAINCISPCLCPVLIGFNPLPTESHGCLERVFQAEGTAMWHMHTLKELPGGQYGWHSEGREKNVTAS